MSKKTNKQKTQVNTCAGCGNGTIIPTKDGNPRLAIARYWERIS